MNNLKVNVENGVTTISAPIYKLNEIKESLRQILNCESKYSLSSISFIEKNSSISPEIQSALQFLEPQLHLDLLEAADKQPLPESSNFTELFRKIKLTAGSFLVEIFGKNQPNHLKCQLDKNYSASPIYTLYIPIPIPIMFKQSSTNELELYLNPSSTVSIAVAQNLLELALQSLSIRNVAVSHYKDVDVEGFEQDLQVSLSNSINAYVLKSTDNFNEVHDSKSFNLYAIPKNENVCSFSDQKYLDNVKNRFERTYFKIERRKCNGCGTVYSDSSNEPCKKYVIEDNLIPFPDGKTEQIEADENGEEIVLVNTENGPVMKDVEGEIELNVCDHQGESAEPISKWSFEVIRADTLQ